MPRRHTATWKAEELQGSCYWRFLAARPGSACAEDLLDQLPFPLADRVPRVARGPAVDRAAFVLLGHVRREPQRADVARQSWRRRSPCRRPRSSPAARAEQQHAPPRVRPCRSPPSHRHWPPARGDCRAARGPRTRASLPSPGPCDTSWASGSVVDCMGVVLPRLPVEVDRRIARIVRRRRRAGVLALKLLRLAHASSSVPSTVKCSSDSRPASRAWPDTASKNAPAMSPVSSRSRFLLKVVGDQIGSSMLRPTNQRNSTL